MATLGAMAALLAICGGSNTSDARGPTLTDVIRIALREAAIPGAIIGIWQDGQRLYVRTFGVRDLATGQPMTTDLHVRIGSITKTFVVTAVLQLVDQGKVGLDDPIDRYVSGVPRGGEITIRQLAGMSSGLYSYTDVVIPIVPDDPARQWTLPELLAIGFKGPSVPECPCHPLLFEPGTAFDYSNTNTILLGLVVEKVSGQMLETLIDEHILKPLGLTHTVFPTDPAIPSPRAEGYTVVGGRVVNASDWNPSWAWAAGEMISTLDDLRVWARVLGAGQLLSPALRRERDRFLPAPQEGDGAEYGLGVERDNGWIGHNGNIPGYVTYAFYLPPRGITMVVMVNSNANVVGVVRLMQAITRVISPDHVWPNPPKPS
jgi:D-alanyl-D-alanine carboxypeptidase